MIGLLPALLLACEAEGPARDERAAPTPDGGDPDLLEPWAAEPVWTVEETQANVQAMIELGFPNARAPYLAYLSLMEKGDEACPGDPTQIVGQEIGVAGCDTADGYHYEGNTTLVETDIDDGELVQRGFNLGGDFLIEDNLGYRLAGGGTMTLSITEAGARKDWGSQTAGTWIHTLREDWLGQGISSTLAARGTSGSESEDTLALQGTLGLADVYVQVDLVWPTGCAGHATGEMLVRDPSGAWGTVVFDDRCDGCGAWTFDATGDTGEICLDLRAYGSAIAELGTW